MRFDLHATVQEVPMMAQVLETLLIENKNW
jgi:hypothetical protein